MSNIFSRYRLPLIATLISMMASPVFGQNSIPREQDSGHDNDCEELTRVVEKTFALPTGILTSISRVEAGRVMENGEQRAWPWTINHAGKGVFFDNKDEMLEYVRDHLDESEQNIDIGCMQINHFWHGDQFLDLDEMADPFTNIVYSAIFLTDLMATHDSWDQAIRHYHNANPAQNTPYAEKVYAVWDTLNMADNTPILVEIEQSSDSTAPINLITATPPELPPVANISVQDQALPSDQAERALIQEVAHHIPDEPDEPKEIDPLAQLKAEQPHLRGKWEKVIAFRQLLNP